MKYNNIIKTSLLNNRRSNMATVAVIGGVAIGLAVGTLLATNKGKNYKGKIINFFAGLTKQFRDHKNRNNNLGTLVENVRDHVRNNAEGLLGPEKKRINTSKINIGSAGSNAWKNRKEKTIFPDKSNPKND